MMGSLVEGAAGTTAREVSEEAAGAAAGEVVGKAAGEAVKKTANAAAGEAVKEVADAAIRDASRKAGKEAVDTAAGEAFDAAVRGVSEEAANGTAGVGVNVVNDTATNEITGTGVNAVRDAASNEAVCAGVNAAADSAAANAASGVSVNTVGGTASGAKTGVKINATEDAAPNAASVAASGTAGDAASVVASGIAGDAASGVASGTAGDAASGAASNTVGGTADAASDAMASITAISAVNVLINPSVDAPSAAPSVVEVRNLKKNFRKKQALNGLNMTVPQGAVYGLVGEDGAGKTTAEKIICGRMSPNEGSVKLYGTDGADRDAGGKTGFLIDTPRCFPNLTVWSNMKWKAARLGVKNADVEIRRVLRLMRADGCARSKFKNCSADMKRRIAIAMALLGRPKLLVLDEPFQGLDADGARILRGALTGFAKDSGGTVLISSHTLDELEKIATHYGILREGRMLREMTAAQLDADCPRYIALQAGGAGRAKELLAARYSRVEGDGKGELRVYDKVEPEEIVRYLYGSGILVTGIETRKISLEEYYTKLMASD